MLTTLLVQMSLKDIIHIYTAVTGKVATTLYTIFRLKLSVANEEEIEFSCDFWCFCRRMYLGTNFVDF